MLARDSTGLKMLCAEKLIFLCLFLFFYCHMQIIAFMKAHYIYYFLGNCYPVVLDDFTHKRFGHDINMRLNYLNVS